AFLNQVEELQSAVGIFFRDGDHKAKVRLDQLALGLLGVHISLDQLALGAFEFLKKNSSLLLEFFQFSVDGAGLAFVFLALLVAAGGVGFALQVLCLAVERTHAIHRFVYAVNEALALVVGEAELAHADRSLHERARQVKAVTAMVLGTLLLRNLHELFLQLLRLFVGLGQFIDFSGELFEPVEQDFFGDFFL